ncbi:hypothetical protein MBLNU459_g4009t1 [Dothideomycetes sp. NU459]
MSLKTLLLVYVAGGLTFVPLVLLAVLAVSYVAFTKPAPPAKTAVTQSERDELGESLDEAGEKSKTQHNEPDVAAAYFAVCREYVPGGINGKPPERSTPAGEVLISESPSVYQSMYRSLFERGKTQIPTIEADRKDGKVKKARNVFFVVLRHGHLMLYDDSEQLEVRHVISLTHHDVDVYAGGEPIGEGDLWIKRNCIRLTRKPLLSEKSTSSRPFYFFSDNCSEKEDFYHTLLQAQSLNDASIPVPQQFDTPDVIKLVQRLHSPDADSHSRWLNALIGRIFLAMYKTGDMENFVRSKINRKIARVPKPNFIASIQIQDIDMGDSAPIVSNARMKELTVNGDVTVEADVKYNGGFKLQMGAVARIDLGARFKAREVDLVMAGILRKLSGHLLIRIKPPPSNRLWITFESMPQIELSIEPVVSSRQITYGVILRAIESRIREVIGETIVLPNWDDSPFLDTAKKMHRGGIWEKNGTRDDDPQPKRDGPDPGVLENAMHELGNSSGSAGLDTDEPAAHPLSETRAKTMSMPSLFEPVQKLNLRKSARKSLVTLAGDDIGASSSTSSFNMPEPSSPPLLPRSPPQKPKPMRSTSFASAATPLVSTEDANAEAMKPDVKKKRGHKDAVELVKEVNLRSQSGQRSPSLAAQQVGTASSEYDPDVVLGLSEQDQISEMSLGEQPDSLSIDRRASEPVAQAAPLEGEDTAAPSDARPHTSATIPIPTLRSPSQTSLDTPTSTSAPSPSHLGTAANAAKKWGWQVLNRQAPSSSTSNGTFGFAKLAKASAPAPSLPTRGPEAGSPSKSPDPNALRAAMLAKPMGRGQPLPPPGTPLPGPQTQKSLWSASSLNIGSLKRKPVAPSQPPALPPRRPSQSKPEEDRPRAPPPLPARSKPEHQHTALDPRPKDTSTHAAEHEDDVLVVAAPQDESAPASPLVEVAEADFTAHEAAEGQNTRRETEALPATQSGGSMPVQEGEVERAEPESHAAQPVEAAAHMVDLSENPWAAHVDEDTTDAHE